MQKGGSEVNLQRLRAEMVTVRQDRDITIEMLSKLMPMSNKTLGKRLKQPLTNWKVGEILSYCEVCGISKERIGELLND